MILLLLEGMHGRMATRRSKRGWRAAAAGGASSTSLGRVSVIDIYRAQFDRVIRALSYQELLRRMTNRLASL